MEKHHSESSAKRLRGIGDAFHNTHLTPSAPRMAADKPSRDEIARCINIWATVYRLRDDPADSGLCMPPRRWTDKTAPVAERD
jgi:hypothetical protein